MSAKEVTLFANSEELSSTSAFKASVGKNLCTPESFSDCSWSHDDWRQTLFLTRDKLMKFESVTISTDSDGDLVFKHGDKKPVNHSPERIHPKLPRFTPNTASS